MVGGGATKKILKSQWYNSKHWIKFRVNIVSIEQEWHAIRRDKWKPQSALYLFDKKKLLSGPKKIKKKNIIRRFKLEYVEWKIPEAQEKDFPGPYLGDNNLHHKY